MFNKQQYLSSHMLSSLNMHIHLSQISTRHFPKTMTFACNVNGPEIVNFPKQTFVFITLLF